jgi:hypothetical protein
MDKPPKVFFQDTVTADGYVLHLATERRISMDLLKEITDLGIREARISKKKVANV